ncbi:hypothetical protein [Aurantimonas coralicida]|uniref:hypothetical protein n=1 Tax=Aurantimonas coralicida TaxID=182270 RepID=UPI001E49E6C2|nr:hypothetical protein [Aurantimonas coralicida]MCD1645700.1 hypothetical protein [Aurantimonas coralicida]
MAQTEDSAELWFAERENGLPSKNVAVSPDGSTPTAAFLAELWFSAIGAREHAAEETQA